MRQLLFLILSLCISISIIGCSPAKEPEEAQPAPAVPDVETYHHKNSNVLGKLYTIGDHTKPYIALTFDDGPDTIWTPNLLKILEEKKIKATFFIIGENAERHPDMLKQIYDSGHVIGNHTYSHANLTKLTEEQISSEIDKGDQAIHNVIGQSPALVRPPYGFHNAQVDSVINAKNDVIILWTTDTKDWTGPSAKTIEDEVVTHVRNGMIVLQHDGDNPKLGNSLTAVPVIIDKLRKQGYEFVTLPELLHIEAYHSQSP